MKGSKKKAKPLPAKEARELVEKQKTRITVMELQINSLQNDVQSLEGARQNLRMMYESNEGEVKKAKQDTVNAIANVRAVARERDEMARIAGAFEAQVRAYEAEGAVHMWMRSMKLALRPITKPISSFFERVKYRLNKGRG